ncbi:MAG TPA: DUF2652 domain-containing protein, partial [Candidatus Limnocylindrales bacterium]|nr:DUF2652 domain-containing protein [Candidatus Limnocylindrales bacterium]
FRLAKLEGDAAFAYSLGARVDGSQLLDTIERTYFTFRRRLRDISQATACECNACTLMPRLDLKFVAHCGSIIRHRIAGHEELVGSDVIVVHRLLKNHVVEELALPAYALFSAGCVAAMSIDPVALGMREQRETYDDLGEVTTWVHDLGRAWATELDQRRVRVSEPDAGYSFESVQPAPRDVVWAFMTDPTLRPRWQFGVTAVEELPTAPRRGVGTTNHCMHGADVLVEEILDWRPTDYVTHRSTMSNGFRATSTFEFEDDPGGTRVRIRFTWGKNRRERELPELAFVPGLLGSIVEPGQAKLHEVLVDEMAERAALAAAAGPEPEPPASDDRELREPVRR